MVCRGTRGKAGETFYEILQIATVPTDPGYIPHPGSIAKTDATNFRIGGSRIDGTVRKQGQETARVRGLYLLFSEPHELRNHGAFVPGGTRLTPSADRSPRPGAFRRATTGDQGVWGLTGSGAPATLS